MKFLQKLNKRFFIFFLLNRFSNPDQRPRYGKKSHIIYTLNGFKDKNFFVSCNFLDLFGFCRKSFIVFFCRDLLICLSIVFFVKIYFARHYSF